MNTTNIIIAAIVAIVVVILVFMLLSTKDEMELATDSLTTLIAKIIAKTDTTADWTDVDTKIASADKTGKPVTIEYQATKNKYASLKSAK